MHCIRCPSDRGLYYAEPCHHGLFCDPCKSSLSAPLAVCPSCPADADPISKFSSSQRPQKLPTPKCLAEIQAFPECEASFNGVNTQKDAATALYKQGKFWEAARSLTGCIKASSKLDKPIRAVLHSNRSLILLALKEYSMAMEDAEEALSLDFTNLKAQFRIAKASLELGDYARAEFFAEKVLQSTEDVATRQVLTEARTRKTAESLPELPQVSDAVIAKIKVPPPPHTDENSVTVQQVSVAKPAPTKVGSFKDVESVLRRRLAPDDLVKSLPVEDLAYYARTTQVLFKEPDLFNSFINTVDQVSDRLTARKYFETLISVTPGLDTMVAMMTGEERKVYNKLTEEFKTSR
jgi:tetratricopeptide (TPR) repeat protein